MKKMRNSVIIIVLLANILLFSGCIIIVYLNQPSSALALSSFEVNSRMQTDQDGNNVLCIAILLPTGWTIAGNSFAFTGSVTGSITYNSTLSANYESSNPAPSGYYWWIGSCGASIGYFAGDYIDWNLVINTDSQLGTFQIEYLSGYQLDDDFINLNIDETRTINISYMVPTMPSWGIILVVLALGISGALFTLKKMRI